MYLEPVCTCSHTRSSHHKCYYEDREDRFACSAVGCDCKKYVEKTDKESVRPWGG